MAGTLSSIHLSNPPKLRQPPSRQQEHHHFNLDDEHERVDAAQLIATRFNLPRHIAELLCSLAGIGESAR